MKKLSNIGITFVLILTMFVVSTPRKAKALDLPIPIPFAPEIAPGSWSWTTGVIGYEVQPDSLKAKAPIWRLIKTNGLVLSSPAYMCHEFTGNQVGWTGHIYMLNGDSWTKLATTVDWVPTREGKLMACAQAPAAGTFALFAYWEKPEGWQPACNVVPFSIKASEFVPICSLGVINCFCEITTTANP